MVRRLELNNSNLVLKEDEIEGFLERTVTPIGTSGKAEENPEFGEDQKESKGHKRRLFAYSFAIMDLDSRLYIAFGSSMRWPL